MKIENEITGHVKIHTSSRLQIELWIKDEQVDFFTLDLEAETVVIHVEKSTRVLLGMRRVYEDYIKLIADLGLEPESYKKHWTPPHSQEYYTIGMFGDIQDSRFSNCDFSTKLLKSYNIFPSRELAEKAVNLSKLGRLILLWQYANDCILTPDWRDSEQCKYYIMYNYKYSEMRINIDFSARQDKPYFQTREQAKAFVEMYKKEIKDTMEI